MRGDVAAAALQEHGSLAGGAKPGEKPAHERPADAASAPVAFDHDVFEQRIAAEIDDDRHADEFTRAFDDGDAFGAVAKGSAELLFDHAFQTGCPVGEIARTPAP